MKPDAIKEAALVRDHWLEDVFEQFAAKRKGLVENDAVGVGKALGEYFVDGFPACWRFGEILSLEFPALNAKIANHPIHAFVCFCDWHSNTGENKNRRVLVRK